MKQSLAWIEKFIAPEKQKEILALPSHQQIEVLNTLIEAGQVNGEEFLAWASQLFLLPSLDSAFFSQVDLQPVWKKYGTLASWNSFLLPVSEWENRLMIACVVPPEDFKIKLEVPPMFVLASPIDLKKSWARLHPQPLKVAPPAPEKLAVAPAPQAAKTAPPPAPKLVEPAAQKLVEPAAQKLVEPAAQKLVEPAAQKIIEPAAQRQVEPAAQRQVERPAQKPLEPVAPTVKKSVFTVSIDPNFKPIELGEQTQTITPHTESALDKLENSDEAEEPIVIATNKIDAPSFNFSAPKKVEEQAPSKPVLELEKQNPVEKPEAKLFEPVAQAKPLGPPVQQKPLAPPPPPPQQQQAAPPPPPLKVVTTEVQKVATPPPPAKKGAKSELKRALNQSRGNFDLCVNLAEVCDVMFASMAPNFEMSMLVLSDDQNLKVAYWSGNFKPSDETKPSPISVAQPSIFKVVTASCKPYHGYVVANHTNSKFFSEWNSGEIPKHVTIYPIIISKELVGMWIGCTSKAIDQKTSLIEMDSLNDSCIPTFKKTLKAAA